MSAVMESHRGSDAFAASAPPAAEAPTAALNRAPGCPLQDSSERLKGWSHTHTHPAARVTRNKSQMKIGAVQAGG